MLKCVVVKAVHYRNYATERDCLTAEFLPVFLVGAEDVLHQQLVLGEPLPGDGHELLERESVATTHRVQLRILINVCAREYGVMSVCCSYSLWLLLTLMKVLNFSFFLRQSLIKVSAFTYYIHIG